MEGGVGEVLREDLEMGGREEREKEEVMERVKKWVITPLMLVLFQFLMVNSK